MNNYKVKSFSIVPGAGWMETKIDAPGRKVMGYFAAFGNKDSDGDIIMPGAFAKTIAERGPKSGKNRILYLRDHNSSQVIGKLEELHEDDKGLYFEGTLAPTPLGDETLELYKMGALNEHSIGYQTVRNRWDASSQTNYLEEIKLWEGSVVPWGANENTPVVGMKDFNPSIDIFKYLDELTNQAPTDEYKQKMLLFMQQLKAEAEAALKDKTPPPPLGTDTVVEPQDNATLIEAIEAMKQLKNAIIRRS